MRSNVDTRYELLAEAWVAQGGVSHWRAREVVGDRPVLVTRVPVREGRFRRTWLRIRTRAAIRRAPVHVSLSSVTDAYYDGGLLHLVQAWPPEASVRSMAAAKLVTQADAVWLGIDLLNVLTIAHERGQAHGAVDPDAVRLTPTGSVFVAGFGEQSIVGHPSIRPGAALVHPEFQAPELSGHARRPTRAADLYGLGAVLHFAMTGRGPQPGALVDTVALGPLAKLVTSLLATAPSARPTSTEAASGLLECAGVLNVQTVPPPATPPVVPPVHTAAPAPRLTGRVRRRTLIIGGVAAAGVAGTVGVLAAARPARSSAGPGPSRSPGPNPSPSAPPVPGAMKWKASVPPLKLTSRVVATGNLVVVDTTDLVAVAVADGSVAWRLPGPQHVVSMDGGVLYTQVGSAGAFALATVDLATGVATTTAVAPGEAVQTMTVAGGVAYCICNAYVDDRNGVDVRAFEVSSGTQLWAFRNSLNLAIPPVVDDDHVYVGGTAAVWALDRSSGVQVWENTSLRGTTPSIRASADGIVHARGTGGMYGLDPGTGAVKWTLFRTDGPYLNSAAGLNGGRVYASAYGTAQGGGLIRAVDAATGRQIWQNALTTGRNRAVFYRSAVYASGNTTLVSADPDSGQLRWNFDLDDQCRIGPLGVQDLVIVPTNGGTLYAVNA